MGKVDTTLFTKKIGKDLFVLQIYADDIIFGSTNQEFCEEFGKMMANEFEMSMIGELSYFLGLQIKQLSLPENVLRAFRVWQDLAGDEAPASYQ